MISYPSGNPYPILRRLDADATGMEVHVSNYRIDAADAAWAIRQLEEEVARLREGVSRLKRSLGWMDWADVPGAIRAVLGDGEAGA